MLFPELAVSGYPPEDLLLKEHFLRASAEALTELASGVEGIVVVVGYPERTEDVFNSIAVIADGAVRASYRKTRLWNYGVADEERYFQAGPGAAVIDLGGARIGLTICEDIWVPGAPASEEAEAGASLIVNPSSSPYHRHKGIERERMLVQRARDNLAAVAFCNTVGGQDELVFDGHSLLIDHEGTVLARAPQFEEALVIATVDLQAALTARLRDTRLRPPAQKVLPEIRHAGRLERPSHPAVEVLEGAVADLLGARRGGLRRAAPGRARLRRQERLQARRDRALGRDRLDAGGAAGRRRARAGEGHVRRDALALVVGRDAVRRAAAGGEPRRGVLRPADRAGDGDLRADAGRSLPGARAGPHRGEPAGAHPRQPADGALQQVRLARADDRQQVRGRRSAIRRCTATPRAASR